MIRHNELSVVYEGGVLRPEQELGLPERTRLVISIRRVEMTAEADAQGRKRLHEIRSNGEIRLGSWHPSREELHERRSYERPGLCGEF